MNNKLLVILVFGLFMAQCRTDEAPTELGYAYFPLDSSKFWLYQMDSISFEGFEERIDTFNYQVLERIEAEWTDDEGDLTFRLGHYFRPSWGHPWRFYKFSAVKRNEYTAERVLHNQRIVVLNFPVNDFKSWDANAYNMEEEELLRIKDMDQAFAYDSFQYPRCVRVEQRTEIDNYFHSEGHSYYAWNVGLIYETKRNTETQNGKTNGYQYTKKLLDTN